MTLIGFTGSTAGAQSGRNLYVGPGGSDANSGGSTDQAWRSFQHAGGQLQAGDTLWVLEGTYDGFSMGVQGRSDAWIRIANFPGATPLVDAGDGNGAHLNDASYLEIRGLEFKGDAATNQNPFAIGMLITGDSHHLRVVRNQVHDFGAGGIITFLSGDHLEFYHNTIYNNANWNPDQHSGMSLLGLVNDGSPADGNGYNNYVVGNLIYNNEVKVKTSQFGGGTRVTDGNCFVMDVTLESNYTGRTLFGSNICVDNGGRGTQVYKSAKVDVVNNTFYQNMRTPDVAGIGSEVMAYDSEDVRFANNLIISRDGVLPLTAGLTNPVAFQNNLTVGTRNPAKDPSDRHLASGTRVLTAPSTNPADLTAANFTPHSSSVALDRGVADYMAALPVDFAGNARLAGNKPDNGALERGASAAPAWIWNQDLPAPTGVSTPEPTPEPPTTVEPTDARVNAVGRLYSAAFLRAPDTGGLDYWSTQNLDLVDIAYYFSTSDEFVNTYGTLNNTAYVDRIYRNVLGRSPDAAGEAYWNDLMVKGLTRAEVLLYFSDSAEYRAG